jgi:hypothetical protein
VVLDLPAPLPTSLKAVEPAEIGMGSFRGMGVGAGCVVVHGVEIGVSRGEYFRARVDGGWAIVFRS